MSAGIGRPLDRFIVYATSAVLLSAAAATFVSAVTPAAPRQASASLDSSPKAPSIIVEQGAADFGLF